MKWFPLSYLLSSLIPLIIWDAWFIRLWDFPRLQFLILGLTVLALYIFRSTDTRKVKILIAALTFFGVGLDLYRILPYSSVWEKETLATESKNPARTLSIVTVNVLQFNHDYKKLLDLINSTQPDLILLLEVNQAWVDGIKSIETSYPERILNPLENTYGLAFYSKLKLSDSQIRFLIEDDIPSLHTQVHLRSGETFTVYGVHPRPPHYKTKNTTERDAELVTVAKEVRNIKGPVIVMGDLNDVAWSHTTRLFRRISKLLDPRIGRGSYPTFPATYPLFCYPLDYVFHSDDWTLNALKRLEDIGSDHFPMFISFTYAPHKEDEQKGIEIERGDLKEAKKTIEKAKKG
jgi:endonuclease/exonuclease/phosphatase (EEP) superfamily protein YafD